MGDVPPRRLLVGEEAAVVAAYEAGATVEALAERHGCSTPVIRSVLEAQGVARRPRGPRSPLEGVEDDVVADYRAGATVRQLVDAYGADQRTIRKVLAERGVAMRPPGRRAGGGGQPAGEG